MSIPEGKYYLLESYSLESGIWILESGFWNLDFFLLFSSSPDMIWRRAYHGKCKFVLLVASATSFPLCRVPSTL